MKSRRSLKTEISVAFVLVLTLVAGGTTLYFVRSFQESADAFLAEKSASMKEELQARGAAVAQNIALASQRAITTLDFLFLQESADAAVKQDPELRYAMIVDAKGIARVHS